MLFECECGARIFSPTNNPICVDCKNAGRKQKQKEHSCEHYANGQCRIATNMAGLPIMVDTATCAKCKQAVPPRTLNDVTCNLTYNYLKQTNQFEPRHLVLGHCLNEKLEIGGPGTELEIILRKFYVRITSSCDCSRRKNLMNEWGPDISRKNLKIIVDWLTEEINSRNMLLRFMPGLRLWLRLLVLMAIRRATKNVQKHLCNKPTVP